MGAKYEWSDGTAIELKSRISALALARFAEKAPELWRDITDIYLNRDQWRRIRDDADNFDEQDAERHQRMKRAEVNFELVGHSVESLKALIGFCESVTFSVSGFADADGEPSVWKHMSEEERLALYELDVPTSRMVTMVLDCWAHKNGLIDINKAQ